MCFLPHLKDSLDRSAFSNRGMEVPQITGKVGKRQIDRLDRYLTHTHSVGDYGTF